MSDGSTSRDESRAGDDIDLSPLDHRIETRSRALREIADMTARMVCRGEAPSWGTAIDHLDRLSIEMRDWAREARELAEQAKF